FSKKQLEYWRLANHRWNIKQGATRSGKTFLDYYLIPKRILDCKGNGLIVLLGNTRGTLNRNVLEPMRNIWGKELVGNIGADNTVNMFGRKVHTLGADKVTQVQKLQGAGIEYCYGDEVTTWNEEVFAMLKSRLDKPNSLFDGTCNPDSPNHWLKKFLDSDADIFLQHYTIDDNPFNSPEFVKNLKKEYFGTVYYDRFILGEWAAAEGLVYPMFSPEKHIVNECEDNNGEFYVSIDYGTNNPTSMGLWHKNTGIATRVSEYYYDSKKTMHQLTDEEYYEALENLVGERKIRYVIVDPSAASFITTIKRHGKFIVKKADNRVLDGIRFCSTLLSKNKLKIHSSCSDIIREFGAYRWDNEAVEDTVIKQNDHAMDDMRYFCQTVMRKER
ncbi:MAG: PBSX family phage terminase large subunit, partial [Clostridia bacterium]|nr:PBSX family phage terminase large subunit [Clostridia bacterium]